MTKFYYQIKGKSGNVDNEYLSSYGTPSNWSFPPIFSGMVEAESKNEAKIIIEDLYEKKFPLRVLKKDLGSNEFLLSIEEMKDGSHRHKLFERRECNLCGDGFYVIDKYNDEHQFYKGWEYCSDLCRDEHKQILSAEWSERNELNGSHQPVVYKITNKNSGKCYIGKTSQPFTLRWYQHFFHNKGNKFHKEISNSSLSDWIFEVQEVIKVPEEIKSRSDINTYILERERFWINHYDSINEGYNSI